MGAFAGNKVEGFTMAKGLGLLDMAPFAGYFVKSPWQLLAGVLPPYWVSKAFLAIYSGEGYWIYLLCGLAVHLMFVYVLLNRFSRRIS
jgi:fluoroquinolone transport system permease protein